MPAEIVYVRNKHTDQIGQMSREAFDGYANADFELTPQQRAADAEAKKAADSGAKGK